ARVLDYLERARPVLARLHVHSGSAVFLSCYGKRLEERSVDRIMIELTRASGIGKRITPHTLRRTFATHLLKSRASLRHIQALLGHSNLNTTARYLKLDTTELRRELLLKHPRERF